jgi:hypothetical protein
LSAPQTRKFSPCARYLAPELLVTDRSRARRPALRRPVRRGGELQTRFRSARLRTCRGTRRCRRSSPGAVELGIEES